jgi:hypothetical protein
MLILSKFKDYYDGVVGSMGVDKTIVYDRQQKIIERRDKDFPERLKYKPFKERMKSNNVFQHISDFSHNMYYGFRRNDDYVEVNPFLIGFCGKYYLGWKKTTPSDINITYNFDDVKEYVNDKYNTVFNSVNIHDLIRDIENMDDMSFFRDYNTPTFVVDYSLGRKKDDEFIINPILKKYDFYKIFDAFTAFQEIQMFISGVLGSNENNIIEIDDKHKIQQHGFDYKWSFRKKSNKKKK